MQFGIWRNGQKSRYVELSDYGRYLYQLLDGIGDTNFSEFTNPLYWIILQPGKKVIIQVIQGGLVVNMNKSYENLDAAADAARNILQQPLEEENVNDVT